MLTSFTKPIVRTSTLDNINHNNIAQLATVNSILDLSNLSAEELVDI